MNTLVCVDVAIGVLVLEAIVLLAWRGGTERALPASRVVAMCGAGLALLAALHAQAAGLSLAVVALALACGGAFHALDLTQRLRDRARL